MIRNLRSSQPPSVRKENDLHLHEQRRGFLFWIYDLQYFKVIRKYGSYS
jgi:hypothetical protein